jgi:hypothetical protein
MVRVQHQPAGHANRLSLLSDPCNFYFNPIGGMVCKSVNSLTIESRSAPLYNLLCQRQLDVHSQRERSDSLCLRHCRHSEA